MEFDCHLDAIDQRPHRRRNHAKKRVPAPYVLHREEIEALLVLEQFPIFLDFLPPLKTGKLCLHLVML